MAAYGGTTTMVWVSGEERGRGRETGEGRIRVDAMNVEVMSAMIPGEEIKGLESHAKGFEAEPFFEIAAVEIRSLPKLEGTAHVNMALIVKFMKNAIRLNPRDSRVCAVGKPHMDERTNKVGRLRNFAAGWPGIPILAKRSGPTMSVRPSEWRNCRRRTRSVARANADRRKRSCSV